MFFPDSIRQATFYFYFFPSDITEKPLSGSVDHLLILTTFLLSVQHFTHPASWIPPRISLTCFSGTWADRADNSLMHNPCKWGYRHVILESSGNVYIALPIYVVITSNRFELKQRKKFLKDVMMPMFPVTLHAIWDWPVVYHLKDDISKFQNMYSLEGLPVAQFWHLISKP